MGLGLGIFGADNVPDQGETPALTPAQLQQVQEYLKQQGLLYSRKPITEYGNPKFTTGRPAGLNRDGQVDITLLPGTLATDAEVVAYAAPLVHTHTTASITDYVPSTPWTPELRVNNSAAGITYGVQIGRYSRIGSIVTAHFDFTLTSKGVSVGNATIANLPVGVSVVPATGVIFFQTLTTSHITIIGRCTGTTIEIYGRVSAAASMAVVTGAHLSNTTRMHGTFVYNA